MHIEDIIDVEHFATLVANNEHILIDFWAPWCGPCQSLTPIFESAAEQLPRSIKPVKANVDELQGLAKSLGVRSIPTVILLKNGEIKAQSTGLVSEQTLLNLSTQQH